MVGDARLWTRPLLRRVPDARRSPLPVFDPGALAYGALALGIGVAGLMAAWNAVGLRRWGLALAGFATAIATYWLTIEQLLLIAALGVDSVHVKLAFGHIMHVGGGVLLALMHVQYVRGHALLGGTTLPTPRVLLVLLVVLFAVPTRITIMLFYPWLAE
jgi:hypothetical protein